ncbi:MAG: NusG domain II-containing protein [Anaerorhabdus sp.]|uniref:NusG domain II-containing protein n=1 Tax=Anaerorhabdus sp. TaxID=1872524 RepID=UPI003A8B24B9
MKKKEIIVIVAIVLIALVIFVGVQMLNSQKSTDRVRVIYRNATVMEIDPTKDGEYWFDGSYGKLMVEVKDGKWRITNEDCPNHVCSQTGWASIDRYLPIICLPNEISVELK